jgi:hypothetical protein
MTDYRDLVIEVLADSEAGLIERVHVLAAERDSYRILARAAIHYAHAQHLELLRLRNHLTAQVSRCRESEVA